MPSVFNANEEIFVRCFSFEWKIPDFFPLKDTLYESPQFNYLGLKRDIYLCKSGEYWNIGIFSEECTSSSCWAYFTIGIKKMDGTIYKSFSGKMFANTFDTPSRIGKFLLDSDLLRDKMEIAPQNMLVVFCNISVEENFFEKNIVTSKSQQDGHADRKDVKEEDHFGKAEESTGNEASVHPKGIYKLSDDLRNLFLNGNDFDSTINIGNKEYKVHRAILGARSPVFRKMFAHDTSERNTGKVEIRDCDPGVFEDFLVFLYSGKVDRLSTEKVLGLYVLADKYDVQDVKKEYLDFMAYNLCVDNFCDIVTLALKYNERGLLESATDFFTKNTKEIITSAQWQCFLELYPVESNKLYIKAVDYMMNGA